MASTPLKRKATENLSSSAGKATKTTHNSSITSFFGAPKTVVHSSTKSTPTNGAPADSNISSISSGQAPKFDKEKWASGLSPEVRGLLKLEIETLDESYLSVREIRDEVVSEEFLSLKRFLKQEIEVQKKKVFPPLPEVYGWSRHTPLHTVKAVIVGQDPYHNHNQAHGLCFSVRPPTPCPPSLKNIYTALKKDYPSFEPPPKPNTGLLTPWAERGVLLLNTCLTVRAHEANSHAGKGWERFTQKIIDIVAKTRTHGVVFLAWGTPAAKRVAKIDRKRHQVLQSVHPSPLSAHRGFFECGHFRKANDWLEQRYTVDGIIDWNLNNTVTPISKANVARPTDSAEEAVKNQDDVPAVDHKTATNGATDKVAITTSTKATIDDDIDDDEDAIEAMNALAADPENEANGLAKETGKDVSVDETGTESETKEPSISATSTTVVRSDLEEGEGKKEE